MDNKKLYTLTMKDDSMNPIISKGDVLIVAEPKGVEVALNEIENNKLYVAIIGDDTTTACITVATGGIILSYANRKYPPRYFSNEDIEKKKLRIIGRVVESRHKIN